MEVDWSLCAVMVLCKMNQFLIQIAIESTVHFCIAQGNALIL
jgi:hypothetical protein